ncbi:MAG: response regulator [Deltaproteobacteria bacterium]|nr:response regulator [Deltaproteobacteria bacterium]
MSLEVVVLDDDALQTRVLQRGLTKRFPDACVNAFVDPRVASRAVLDRPPSVVITDQDMPSCSGVEFARTIREALGARCPRVVLVSSARITRSDLRLFDAHLQKPYRLDYMAGILRPWLDRVAAR